MKFLRKIKIVENYGIELKKHSKIGRYKPRAALIIDKACEICGENRTINFCHIIHREHGGRYYETNHIYLCPTHHFLFDQARLSRQEFAKIAISDKPEDVVEFFHKIHHTRHQLFWEYGTNKLNGCRCGSLKFDYDTTIKTGSSVQICLRCINCGLKWCNLWIETHPITRSSIKIFDFLEEITGEEKRGDLALLSVSSKGSSQNNQIMVWVLWP